MPQMPFLSDNQPFKNPQSNFRADSIYCIFIFKCDTLNCYSMFMLPKRNQGAYLKNFHRQNLKTNLFKVEFSDKALIIIYSLVFEPDLPKDSSKTNDIVNSASSQLNQAIGSYMVTGRTLFSCQLQKSKIKDTPIKIETYLEGQKYNITCKPVRTVDLSALNSAKDSDTYLPLNFLNNLMKKFFSSMKYVCIGKNGKYFNPKSKHILSNSGIILFDGYQTKFNICQSGIYLQVQSIAKIVQSRTALEEIDTIYAKNSHLNKEEKRQAVKEHLVGSTVMANYGNSRVWFIKQVIFDFDLEKTKISQDSNMNFLEYYQQNYGIQIHKKKQPVFKAVLNGTKRSKLIKQSILIPELLLMSGLSDDFDQRRRRQISEFTIVNPQEKMNRIQHLISDFNSDSENFNPNSVSKTLGVKISQVTENTQAILLPPPVIQLGKGDAIEKQKVACFQLFNKEIYRHDVPINIVVIVPHDYDFDQIDKLFSSTCKNLCLKYLLNVIKLSFQDQKKAMADIQKFIEDPKGQFDNFDLNWLILPPNMKSQYKTIKRLSVKSENPKATQVTLTSTLAKKGFASILTKILIQISSKVGNIPWAPRIPAGVPQRTMLLGIDTCKEAKNNIVAYCCTTNKEMTKFHSNYLYEPKESGKFNAKIGDLVSDCLATYTKLNSFVPDELIVIKAAISEGQRENITTAEINQIKSKLKDMDIQSLKLTFMTANKSSKQRFFLQGRSITNPGYGTLINSKVVSKNYDFYLIAQHCNRGTVKPIHYTVLYTQSKMEEGVLQELIYCQSFNYMNWSGSVRVPSVLQYSTKLCSFVADNINRASVTNELNEKLYFI